MAHEQLCTPPDRIAGDVEKLARWRPRVRSDIDWNALQRGAMDNSGSTEADNGTHGDDDISDTEQAESAADEEEASPSIEPAFLSVGLIGQPKYAYVSSADRSRLTLLAALVNPLSSTHS